MRKNFMEMFVHDTPFDLQSTNCLHAVNDQRKAYLSQLLHTETMVIRKCHCNRTNENPRNT